MQRIAPAFGITAALFLTAATFGAFNLPPFHKLISREVLIPVYVWPLSPQLPHRKLANPNWDRA